MIGLGQHHNLDSQSEMLLDDSVADAEGGDLLAPLDGVIQYDSAIVKKSEDGTVVHLNGCIPFHDIGGYLAEVHPQDVFYPMEEGFVIIGMAHHSLTTLHKFRVSGDIFKIIARLIHHDDLRSIIRADRFGDATLIVDAR